MLPDHPALNPKSQSEMRSSVTDTSDISQRDPQGTNQMATSPSIPSTYLARSPRVGTGEFSSPGNNTALGTGADGLPEQTIFPGIVHERALKGNKPQ